MDKLRWKTNIIIILLGIIVILAMAIGVLLLNSTIAKELTKIKITSDNFQYEDDAKLSIQLTDANKTSISREIVNITITNKKGKVVVDDVVKTNSKGKAKLDLDLKKCKYIVNVTLVEMKTILATTQHRNQPSKKHRQQVLIRQNLFMMDILYLIKMVNVVFTVNPANSSLIQHKTHHIKHFKKQMTNICYYSFFRIHSPSFLYSFLYWSCLLVFMVKILISFTNKCKNYASQNQLFA